MELDMAAIEAGDVEVVASVSGGKDSTAMCLHFQEMGIPHRRVYMNTGWEAQETYDYIRGPLADAIGPIEELEGFPGGMPALVRKKGMFPSRLQRFCTQELKVKPIRKYLRAMHEQGVDTINAVGIRRAESRARSKLDEWEWSDYLSTDVWRPLIAWSEQDVIDIHARHGVEPNPLYLRGAERVGCWPCIFARKSEIRQMADTDPARVDEIRELEAEVQEAAHQRYAAKGETFESLGYAPPTFFHKHDAGSRERQVSIDDVVTWSRTARGGRQFELFAPRERDMGCMRWGLCDAGPGGDDDGQG